MSHHIRCGIHLPQFVDEGHQGRFLKECARVAGAALLVQSPFVADADGVGVVPLAVRPNAVQRTARPDGAIHGDVEVVADAVEAPLAVPTVDVLHRYALPRQGGGAVDDEEADRTHWTLPLTPPKGGEWIVRHVENGVVECKFFKHSYSVDELTS